MSLCIAKIIDGDLCFNADNLFSGSGIARHDVVTDSVLKAMQITIDFIFRKHYY